MMAALPDKPYATPHSLRHVLVLCRAAGWVHTSIPLAAKMVEYLGDKTGAWITTITYDAAFITPENLVRVVFLSTSLSVASGIAAGCAITLAMNTMIEKWAKGNSRDPMILLAGALLLSVVAAIACSIPARRACKIDPMTALRCE